MDFRNSGIIELTNDSIANINRIYAQMMRQNSKHEQNLIKISFSNLKSIDAFDIQYVNIALYIQNSDITSVSPMSLEKSSSHIELNIVDSRLDCNGWVNLLDSANLRLLSLRNIPNLISVFEEAKSIGKRPFASITDLKVYNSPMPKYVDTENFLFNVITYIEQLELIGCSITKIQDSVFATKAFVNLRVLIMSNNNLKILGNNTFTGLKNLIILDLDDNPIEHIESNTFNGLKKLKSLSLNGNVKLAELLNRPHWLNQFLFSNISTNLNQINIKTEQWNTDFCLIENFTKFNFISTNYTKVTRENKQLNLFYTEDILDSNVLETDLKVYCNFKYICHNQMYYSNAIWNYDMQKVCEKVSKSKRTKACPFYQMSKDCIKNITSIDQPKMSTQSKILSTEINLRTTSSDDLLFTTKSTTKCSHARFVLTGVRSFIIVLAFAAMVFAVLTLGLFYYTYSNGKERYRVKRKYYGDNSIDEKKTMVSQSSGSDSMTTIKSNNFDMNDYYVFFLSSKQIKR
jgi:hypothetical protein